MKHKTQTAWPIVAIFLFAASCATIQQGQDKTLVNAQRTITSSHATVYSLYRLENDNYAFFKSKAPEQAGAVRRQVNVLRRNYPQIEQDAWNAVEAYRQSRNPQNQANLSTALAVLSQVVEDAKGYVSKINSAK